MDLDHYHLLHSTHSDPWHLSKAFDLRENLDDVLFDWGQQYSAEEDRIRSEAAHYGQNRRPVPRKRK